jgi:hypothetical protein
VDALDGLANAGSGLKSKLKSLPQAIRRTAARAGGLEDMRPIQYWRHGNAFHEIVFRLYVRPPEIERIATVILVASA